MLENIATQLFCADNKLIKSAALLSLVSVRSCIECYKSYVGVDEFIHDFIGSFDGVLEQASSDLDIPYDRLSDFVSLYDCNDMAIINDAMNKLIKPRNLFQAFKSHSVLPENSRNINYKKDKDALNALADLL